MEAHWAEVMETGSGWGAVLIYQLYSSVTLERERI